MCEACWLLSEAGRPVGFAPGRVLQRDGALRRYMSASAETAIPRDLLQDVDSQVCGADESEFHGASRKLAPRFMGELLPDQGSVSFPKAFH